MKGELDNMTDTTQKIEQLKRELAIAKEEARKETQRPSRTRNFDFVGPDPNASHKDIPGSSDIPDVGLLPRKQKRTENKW